MNYRPLLLTMLITLVFCSCSQEQRKYVIGVSQCSEDSWREKLHDEMDMATYFYEGVDLRYACANDDYKLQMQQIDSLVETGLDLLIVSPQQITTISPAIDRAYEKGIPVILFDRKTDSDKYTTFMGADNVLIGELLAHYIMERLPANATIIEIEGEKDSSPAIDRKYGFEKVMSARQDVKIISMENDNWTEESGVEAMDRVLASYNGGIDCVFGANDRIAVGAKKSLQKHNIECSGIIFAGVDALPTKDGGMTYVRDGILNVSAVYPTHGDELLQLAIDILDGKKFSQEIKMNTSLVTLENAKVLLMQNEEIIRQGNNLRQLNRRVDKFISQIDAQRTLLYLLLVVIAVIAVCMLIATRAYHQKNRLNARLAQEKETVERQRDELEEQRDKLIEATIANKDIHGVKETGEDVLTGDESLYREENVFLQNFKDALERHFTDSNLSVEDLADEMKLSRVQLYRKLKALTGLSPAEYIKQSRLKRARLLLSDSSLNISEIAYKVGFSSPGYFTKCYKDMYGENPTHGRR